MLLQFKFKNHKCFYNETILDLMATQEKGHMDSIIDVNGKKILPVIEINGANASGKSCLLEALQFMCDKIVQTDEYNRFDTFPYAFIEKAKEENSAYEISILLGDYEYKYGFSVNKKGFEEEWLYKKDFVSSSAKQNIIFERFNNMAFFNKEYSEYNKFWDSSENNSKVLVLRSIAIIEVKGIFREIYDYISKFKFKINNFFLREHSIDGLYYGSVIFDKFQKLLNEIDPSLVGVKIEEARNNKYCEIMVEHKCIDDNSENIFIPLLKESDGIIKMVYMIPSILMNLEFGGVMVIDELDVKLHPLVFKRIVSMYNDKSINKNGAQLIFTAHSTFLFNSVNFRRDELYLVEKDLNGKSRLYSLAEFKNLREDADYEKKYLTGQFGAIPYNEKELE